MEIAFSSANGTVLKCERWAFSSANTTCNHMVVTVLLSLLYATLLVLCATPL